MNYRTKIANNALLQKVFTMILVALMLMYLIFSFKDLAFVYGVAYKNADTVKTDKNITKVVEVSTEKKNKYTIVTVEGETKTLKKPEISYVMNNKKHLSYYSEEENILMLPVDDSFIKNMLLGSSAISVGVSWTFLTALLVLVCVKGNFVVWSRKRILIGFLLLELAFFAYVGISFWMFK